MIQSNKKGQLEIIGAGIVLLIVLAGGLYILATNDNIKVSDVRYVGNTANGLFCDLNNYQYNQIPKNNRIFFVSSQNAIRFGFEYAEKCD